VIIPTVLVLVVFGAIYIYQTPSITDRTKKVTQEFEFDPLTKKYTLRRTQEYEGTKSSDTTASKPNDDKTPDSQQEHPQMPTVVDHRNVALNKPVVEMFLNIKQADTMLQFDQSRLMSHVLYYERYSINLGDYPSNLTDGNHDTRAYPADFVFDYVVDLKGKYKLSKVRLDWGGFGSSQGENNYITGWELYGQQSFSAKNFPSMNDWVLITKGGIPGTRMTDVSDTFLKQPILRLRIKAWSEAKDNKRANWIGIHELEAYGTLLR
jgi:hypothetical protein